MKRQKCGTLYDDFVTAAETYFCGREGGKEGRKQPRGSKALEVGAE